MSHSTRTPNDPTPRTERTASDLERELGRAGYEPLLPIGKTLIGWSLGLGVT